MDYDLAVELQYCFGIDYLKKNFNFSENNTTVLIYASNGTMKTSFAKTFEFLSQQKEPEDLINHRKSSASITINGQPLKPNQIIVANAERLNTNHSKSVSKLLVNRELKEQYDEILLELESLKKEFLKQFKKASNSTDCEREILNTFSDEENQNFYDCLLKMKADLDQNNQYITDIKFNSVFDNKGKVEQFLKKNSNLLDDYVNRYNELVKESDFFSETAKFGTYEAQVLEAALENNAFFNASHSLSLKGQKNIQSVEALKTLLIEQKKIIFEDPSLLKMFDKLDKEICKSAELRAFNAVIRSHREILPELQSYQQFKKRVLVGYLNKVDLTERLIELYESKKPQLMDILECASQEIERWRHILSVYKSRFYVPFDVEISNQKDAVLSLNAPSLRYKYKTDSTLNEVELTDYEHILSKGELRAFFILHYLFDIEANRDSMEPIIVVYDDISDSFDYHNKHAIVEYINDISEQTRQGKTKFYQIILTHNFDFYRTISSRVHGLKVFMASKQKDNKIEFCDGQYRKNYFSFIKTQYDKVEDVLTKKAIFVALLPFVRNLIEFTEGNNEDYLTLTKCLHYKEDSPQVQCIQSIYTTVIHLSDIPCQSTTAVRDLIFEVANNVEKIDTKSLGELFIKFILSMAIRLKLEQLIWNELEENSGKKNISSNQTGELIRILKEKNADIYSKNHELINRVCIMTPEYIHVNTFMYEPLIDSSMDHLLCLYKNINKIQKLDQ